MADILRFARGTSLAAALVMGAVAGLFCFLPGLDAPNYHSSLLLGLIGSLVAGPTGVFAARRAVVAGRNPYVAALRAIVIPALLPLALLLLNGLRVRLCDGLAGLAFMVVGPIFSMAWAATLGAALGALEPRRKVAVTWFYLAFAVWAALDVLHIVWNPAIFAYNPFVGFFQGAIYDTVIEIDDRLLLYRVNNLAQLGLVLAAVGLLWDPAARRGRWSRLTRVASRHYVRFAVLAALALAFWANRGHIGYEVSRAEVQARLGGRIEDERVVLFYDRARIPEAEARALLEDHRFRLEQIEAELGARYPRKIASYVYGSPDDKRLMMGAAQVYIAKPWLDEIHLNRVPYGHTVIRHELAHVVLGLYADPPFHIPTRLCVVPQMALVEGAAETFEWDSGQLTPHEWSHAMREAKQAADLRALLGPGGFLGQGSDKAYTLTGSFVAWLVERHGVETLQAVYGDGDFERVYGRSVSDLIADWERWIDGLDVPEDAAGLATGRFNVKAIQFRPCGLDVARVESEAARLLSGGDRAGAKRAYEQVVAWIPEDAQKRLPLLSLAASSGQLAEVEAAYSAYVSVEANRNVVSDAGAKEILADARARSGDLEAARILYAEIVGVPQGEDRRRTTLVKLALASEPLRARVVLPFILGGKSEDLARAIAHLPGDPLVTYLAARRHHQEGRLEVAVTLLELALVGFRAQRAALTAETPTTAYLPWVERESARLVADALWKLGRYAEARGAFLRVAELTPYGGDAQRYRDWAARCAWKLGAPARMARR